MKKTIIMIVAVMALAGCSNTFDGAGKDIEKAGQKIQETF